MQPQLHISHCKKNLRAQCTVSESTSANSSTALKHKNSNRSERHQYREKERRKKTHRSHVHSIYIQTNFPLTTNATVHKLLRKQVPIDFPTYVYSTSKQFAYNIPKYKKKSIYIYRLLPGLYRTISRREEEANYAPYTKNSVCLNEPEVLYSRIFHACRSRSRVNCQALYRHARVNASRLRFSREPLRQKRIISGARALKI